MIDLIQFIILGGLVYALWPKLTLRLQSVLINWRNRRAQRK